MNPRSLKFNNLDSLIITDKILNILTFRTLNCSYVIQGEQNKLILNYGIPREAQENEIVVNIGMFQFDEWKTRKIDLKEIIEENGLNEEKLITFSIENNGEKDGYGRIDQRLGVDSPLGLYVTKTIKEGIVEEQPRTNPGYELSDVLLGSSNQYNAVFPEKGTFTIYESASGRRARKPVTPITVNGLTQLDLSDLPAGVYVGVYEPQEGSVQVQKIIKTR